MRKICTPLVNPKQRRSQVKEQYCTKKKKKKKKKYSALIPLLPKTLCSRRFQYFSNNQIPTEISNNQIPVQKPLNIELTTHSIDRSLICINRAIKIYLFAYGPTHRVFHF
eukprot:TRINITY_DN504_c0_g1_i1.p2 TRINITY_DN504_c0_g1~~TRINITY_DN504_c0_g1_i1.p2  ORF type:complete len:110 (+),score=10.32 TRINITY_DN504_c0_g1_i1:404-733(+)